nr:catalase [Enterococcus sp. 7E2_DIV0204]
MKYRFRANQGIVNLDENLAKEITDDNPDSHTEDLFNATQKHEFPPWTFFIQLIPLKKESTTKQIFLM